MGWGTLFFSKCSQIFIIGAREFRFVAEGADFKGAQTRGPRLFCRTSRKKVIPGKPRKKLTFAYSHVTVDSELIRDAKPMGPVRSSAEFKSPLLSYPTPINPRWDYLLNPFSPVSQKMQVRGTNSHMASITSR